MPGLVFVLLLYGFPLVDNYHDGSAFLNDSVDELEVVDFEGRECVHDVDHDVGLLDMEHGADL